MEILLISKKLIILFSYFVLSPITTAYEKNHTTYRLVLFDRIRQTAHIEVEFSARKRQSTRYRREWDFGHLSRTPLLSIERI
jgi:hypothetical protein